MDKIFQEIRKVIIQTVQETSEKSFVLSQKYVPERSGELKKSGIFSKLKNGAVIAYLKNYAADIEFGHPEKKYRGEQRIHVRSHIRRSYLRKDGIRVKVAIIPAHDVVYKNARLIVIPQGDNLLFRVMRSRPERKGVFYVKRGIEEGFQSFFEDLRKNLKVRFEGKNGY